MLFRADTDEFKRGYELLSQRIGANFIEERDFRGDLMGLVNPPPSQAVDPLTCFAVDDMIFKKRAWLRNAHSALHNPNVLCFSFRLSPKINYCYSLDINNPPPMFDNQLFSKDKWVLTWDWQKCDGDWGYPFSTDCHVYRTPQLVAAMLRHDWNSPNTMEAALARDPWWKQWSKMACCTDHKVMNVPANIVQNDFKNRCIGTHSPEGLNSMYLNGMVIAWERLAGAETNSCHVAAPYEFRLFGSQPILPK